MCEIFLWGCPLWIYGVKSSRLFQNTQNLKSHAPECEHYLLDIKNCSDKKLDEFPGVRFKLLLTYDFKKKLNMY